MIVITTNDCQCCEEYERLSDQSERGEFNALSARPAGRLRGTRPKSTTNGSVPRTSGSLGELPRPRPPWRSWEKHKRLRRRERGRGTPVPHLPTLITFDGPVVKPTPARSGCLISSRNSTYIRGLTVSYVACLRSRSRVTTSSRHAAGTEAHVRQVPAVTVRASVAEVPGELDQRLVPRPGPALADQVSDPRSTDEHARRHQVYTHDLSAQLRRQRQDHP